MWSLRNVAKFANYSTLTNCLQQQVATWVASFQPTLIVCEIESRGLLQKNMRNYLWGTIPSHKSPHVFISLYTRSAAVFVCVRTLLFWMLLAFEYIFKKKQGERKLRWTTTPKQNFYLESSFLCCMWEGRQRFVK